MNNFRFFSSIIAGAAVFSIAALASVASQAPDIQGLSEYNTEPPADDSSLSGALSNETVADSLRRAHAEALSDRMAALYKDVKFMLYEGDLESNIYPTALATNNAALQMLDSAYNEQQRSQAQSILTDINPLMMRGAVYWSGKGDSKNQSDCARGYLDAQLHPAMSAANFNRDPRLFPLLAYSAAFGASSENDTESAKKYFEAYLSTDDTSQRQNVIKYYGQACLATGDYLKGLNALEEGSMRYPTDMQILTLALQTCLDGDMTDRMQPLLEKALAINPNEEKLQNLQAQLFEKNQDYRSAVDMYLRLAEEHPNSLEIRQHIATCYYNLGASHYNSSIMEEDEKIASRHRRQSKSYFASAANALGHVLANTPSDMKYLTALAHTYAALGEREKFEEANRQIRAFGGKEIAFNAMPTLIGASGAAAGSDKSDLVKAPSYEDFARPYIEKNLAQWAKRGEFETMEDYKKRLTSGATEEAYKHFNSRAEEEYLKNYARQLVINDLRRSDYDIDNQIYRIDTPYGQTIVKVPTKNHEAEAFKAGWETAQIRAPRFIIRDNKVALSRITYVVNGKKYTYNSDDDATYVTPTVYADVNGVLAQIMGGGTDTNTGGQKSQITTGIWKDSDVDVDIPVTNRKANNLYALIIANENYSKAKDVFGALHDGHTFREYCVRTLGIPDNQAVLINNATGNQVRDAMATLARKVKGHGDDAEVILYYAGHGLPDEKSKEAYMMPVDANPLTISTLIPMKEIYDDLGKMQTASTSVFIDACFSGSDRDGDMIKEERGVVLKTKEIIPQGNMFVLSAASAQETALPYREKQHGMFTYFLLKKLQESKGNANLKELSNYVISNVRKYSDVVNGKEQNPTVSTSGNLRTLWDKKKLKP